MNDARKNVILILMMLLFSAALFFFRVGERSFRNPDEGRYAEIAREMVITGNWIEPKIYGVDYLKKPALFYWLTASSFKHFGFNEWAARAVPAIFGVLGVLMTYWFAGRLFNKETAIFASLILATNFWYLQVCRYLVIDAVFSFFVFSGLYFFYSAINAQKNKKLYYLLFYTCVSLSFLAKGVIGIILPGIAAFIYLIKNKKLIMTLKEMSLGYGALIFSLIALPWFVLISLKRPEFLSLFFIHENFSRFASQSFEHQEAWYFYLALLPAILMPWVLFLRPLGLSVGNSNKDKSMANKSFFLLATGVSVVIFFSLSKAKLLTYILPSLPFFSIFIAKAWSDWSEKKGNAEQRPSAWDLLPSLILLLLGFFGMIASPKIVVKYGRDWPKDIGIYFQAMSAIIVACSVACLKAWSRRNYKHVFYILVLMLALLSIPFAFAMEKFNADYTNKHFAEALKPRLHSGDKVFVYDHPGALYDFGFYLNYPVTLVGLEGELELFRKDPDNQKAVLTHAEFWNKVKAGERLFCLARGSDFTAIKFETKKELKVIAADRRKVLFST